MDRETAQDIDEFDNDHSRPFIISVQDLTPVISANDSTVLNDRSEGEAPGSNLFLFVDGFDDALESVAVVFIAAGIRVKS